MISNLREGFLRQAQDKFREKPGAQRGLATKSPTRSAGTRPNKPKMIIIENKPTTPPILFL